MRHEHPARALIELLKSAKTSSSADRVLHHAPKAFDGVKMVATMGRQAMEASRAVIVLEGRIELVRPMDPAAIDDHHNLCADFAEGGHHLMEILASLLGIKVGHDFIKDFGGAILDGPNDTEQHATGDTAPGAMADPRWKRNRFMCYDSVAERCSCQSGYSKEGSRWETSHKLY